ncbi:Arm DNA-binding domain-containing protein [Kingella kingae]|uniref:Arm DNA-binding domain-containing protein n=1 Tax=Kingella kingae TaxID=504 RepID=UPI0025560EF8|nr:Arm DNA-binding domain-containing protein [Kingella kingae]MDK4660665.1 Arm DNA-binding domain-containing protein [Kingella kingae]MDK4668637.1 Arm DNA-binding domain-containing protein [Kingella kingae]MDK4687248.1 Arm DNA-binding domain-containing protein [Kingella kingae]
MLTDRQIRAIKANGKEQKFSDNLNGLVLKVTPKGAKVWIIRINLNGKKSTLTLKPHYPALSLSDARIEAEKAQSLRKQGINPAQLKQEAKKEQQAALLNTFEHLAREWHTHQLARWTTTHTPSAY